ncbi:MAG: BrnA antitoxin family protein [Candidatus Shapirobacteria bacterium]
MKAFKKLPNFKSEKSEREFWWTHDSTDYIDWSKAKNWQFPNLKLTSRPVTLRLPQNLINNLKVQAHRLDLPYQTLIKQLLFRATLANQ